MEILTHLEKIIKIFPHIQKEKKIALLSNFISQFPMLKISSPIIDAITYTEQDQHDLALLRLNHLHSLLK